MSCFSHAHYYDTFRLSGVALAFLSLRAVGTTCAANAPISSNPTAVTYLHHSGRTARGRSTLLVEPFRASLEIFHMAIFAVTLTASIYLIHHPFMSPVDLSNRLIDLTRTHAILNREKRHGGAISPGELGEGRNSNIG